MAKKAEILKQGLPDSSSHLHLCIAINLCHFKRAKALILFVVPLLVPSSSLLAWLSRVRQSKWQPIVKLGTGIYLRTIKISAFTLFDYLTYLLPRSAMLARSPLLCWEVPPGPGRLGRKLRPFMLSSCLQLPVPDATCQGPWAFPSIVSALRFPESSLTCRMFLPVRIITSSFPAPPPPLLFFFFFLRLLLRNPPFWHLTLLSGTQLSHLNNVCTEAQHVICFLIGGSI